MFGLEGVGKLLILVGGLLFLLGLFLAFQPKIHPLGRLPGDIFIQKGNFRIYFPIVTFLLLSLALTILLNIIFRLLK